MHLNGLKEEEVKEFLACKTPDKQQLSTDIH